MKLSLTKKGEPSVLKALVWRFCCISEYNRKKQST